MPNGLYRAGRTAFATGNIKWRTTSGDNIKCMLITRAYSCNLKEDSTLSDIPVAARIGKDGNTDRESFPKLSMATPDDGVCDANDVDFGMVPSGTEIKGVVIFKDAPEDNNTTLVAFVDVDFIANGTQVIIGWDNGPSKIFRL